MNNKINRLSFLLPALFILVACQLSGQTTQKEIFDAPYKAGGVYLAYPDPSNFHNTPAPEGYEPFYISHYGRHGSRYLISDKDYEWVVSLMNKANREKALTPLGKNVLSRIREVWKNSEGNGGKLSAIGEKQHEEIAERMYDSFGTIFEDGSKISARSTISGRCIKSMDVFCGELQKINSRLLIKKESDKKYMEYLCFQTDSMRSFNSSDGPWQKRFRKFRDSLTISKRLINSLFSNTSFINKELNGKDLMWGLYWIAVDMQDTMPYMSFFDLFTKKELFDLWQCFNYQMYMNNANSALSAGEGRRCAIPLLKNIIYSADSTILAHGRGAALRFGHDGNILSLAALMRINGYDACVSNPSELYKKWTDFKISPMGANLQIIFYRNKTDDVIVKFLMNEKESYIPIKAETGPYYKWTNVRNFFISEISGLYGNK
ncbi:MAG: histidine-type phosphatase [Bacteroidales bacterium]|jgi:hypothetical protein|nr:histidine-type phosphatase [Bacteroidales bacterium]